MLNIKTVTVLGANGTMGCNVSGIFASFGNARVYMVCRDPETAVKARDKAALSVKAEAIAVNLVPKTYDDLKECISASDLVFESVFEDFDTKKSVYAKIVEYLQPHTIIGTGSSGLSIGKLSQCFPEKSRPNFMGIHMYNPPYNMILCELIASRETDAAVLADVKEYLESVLYRKVVRVKDGPAFMGNRIGFQFINEALQFAEQYRDNGGIDYIDSILGPFTGRSMAPLVTSDFVGLDIHQAIVDNLYRNTMDYAHDTFVMPEFALKLIAQNRLGRKTGCGLYKSVANSDGTKSIFVYDIASDTYRPREKYVFPFAKHMARELKAGNYRAAFEHLAGNHSQEAAICLQFLIKYVVYGLVTSKAIGEDIHAADDVMATGFSWAPPLAVVDAFGGTAEFLAIARNRMPAEYLSMVDIESVLSGVPASRYDYRPFFKAK